MTTQNTIFEHVEMVSNLAITVSDDMLNKSTWLSDPEYINYYINDLQFEIEGFQNALKDLKKNARYHDCIKRTSFLDIIESIELDVKRSMEFNDKEEGFDYPEVDDLHKYERFLSMFGLTLYWKLLECGGELKS